MNQKEDIGFGAFLKSIPKIYKKYVSPLSTITVVLLIGGLVFLPLPNPLFIIILIIVFLFMGYEMWLAGKGCRVEW